MTVLQSQTLSTLTFRAYVLVSSALDSAFSPSHFAHPLLANAHFLSVSLAYIALDSDSQRRRFALPILAYGRFLYFEPTRQRIRSLNEPKTPSASWYVKKYSKTAVCLDGFTVWFTSRSRAVLIAVPGTASMISFELVGVSDMADANDLHISSHALELNGPEDITAHWGATRNQTPSKGSYYRIRRMSP